METSQGKREGLGGGGFVPARGKYHSGGGGNKRQNGLL